MNHDFARKLYLPLLMVALIAGCADKKEGVATKEGSPIEVAAKVNGADISVGQVNLALQHISNLDPEQAKAASLQVVRNLVDQEVVAQKAVADKLDQDARVKQALEAARRQVLAEAYMARKLGTPTEPSDTEVSDYFDKHPDLFAKRKIYRLQEISIKAPNDRFEAIRAQLAASKTLSDFAEWLKAEKLPIKATQSVKPAEQLPLEILPKLAQMPDGQAIVVNAPDGLLVIVLADSQVQPVTLEQAKPAIVRMLQAQVRQKAAKAELDVLKAAAKIEYLGAFADAGKQDVVPSAPAEPAAAPTTVTAPAADAADATGKGVSGQK
jgi:EpsD family peptidyl-prolyl cis-trans isomerase